MLFILCLTGLFCSSGPAVAIWASGAYLEGHCAAGLRVLASRLVSSQQLLLRAHLSPQGWVIVRSTIWVQEGSQQSAVPFSYALGSFQERSDMHILDSSRYWIPAEVFLFLLSLPFLCLSFLQFFFPKTRRVQIQQIARLELALILGKQVFNQAKIAQYSLDFSSLHISIIIV